MSEERRPLHTRTIRLDGYACPGDLYEVEARLTDVKHYDLPAMEGRDALAAGEPMHDMAVTMTVDGAGTIRAFRARTLSGPHALCQEGAAAFDRLVGLSITRGFMKAAMERVGGVQGCTHLRELLQQMATVAFQSMREARVASYDAAPERKPPLIDSCAAWSSAGEWVKVRFPRFFTGDRGAMPAARPAGER